MIKYKTETDPDVELDTDIRNIKYVSVTCLYVVSNT